MKPLAEKALQYLSPLWRDHAKRQVHPRSFWSGATTSAAFFSFLELMTQPSVFQALGVVLCLALARVSWLTIPEEPPTTE